MGLEDRRGVTGSPDRPVDQPTGGNRFEGSNDLVPQDGNVVEGLVWLVSVGSSAAHRQPPGQRTSAGMSAPVELDERAGGE
jgi:hypothetical protein